MLTTVYMHRHTHTHPCYIHVWLIVNASPQHGLEIGNISSHFGLSVFQHQDVSDAADIDLLTSITYSMWSIFHLFSSLLFFPISTLWRVPVIISDDSFLPDILELTCSAHSTHERARRSDALMEGGERERKKRTRREIWSNKPIMCGALMNNLEEQPASSRSRCMQDICVAMRRWREFVELSIIASDKGLKQTQWVQWWERNFFTLSSKWAESRRGKH